MNPVNKQQDNQSAVNYAERSANKDNKHIIDDELFEKLLVIREDIYKATDINVSPRKLVNMLLRESDFQALRDKLIKQYD